jgi:SP family sugar porter-like MFS transporter
MADDSPRYRMTFLWLICLVAAMGGLLFGYDWVVIGGARPFYEPYFGIQNDPWLQGWGASSALYGCILGALLSGVFSDMLGRKRLLIVAALLFTISALWTSLAGDFVQFNVARILGGIGIGLASNLSPMYIAEISPGRVRGRFVSINQLTIVVGILAAQLVNWLIAKDVPSELGAAALAETWNGQYGWRWMFAAELVPALAFFGLMFLVPESPRWLVKYDRADQAHATLAKIGGGTYATREVSNIRDTLSQEEIGRVNPMDLFEPRLFKILLLGIFLAVFQQWSGLNVIFNYAPEVFAAAGYDVSQIMLQIVITGTVNLLFTFVAIYTVDKAGRRALMMIGSLGLALIYGVLGAGYYFNVEGLPMLTMVVLAIAAYAMSLAPVTWVVLSEIFPNRIRGAAVAVSVFFLWVGSALLVQTFPFLNTNLGAHGTFWLYAGICLVSFGLITRYLPETKGKSLEEVERELVD